MSMTGFPRFAAALVLAFLLPVAMAAPKPGISWTFPCGYSVTRDDRSLSSLLNALTTTCDDATFTAARLQTGLISRLGNQPDWLMNANIAQLSKSVSSCNWSNVNEALTCVYHDLSRYAIFYERLRQQEQAGVNMLSTYYSTILSDTYQMLCMLSKALMNMGSPVTDFQSETIFPAELMNLNDFQRAERDFIVAIHFKTYISSLQARFAAMMA